MPFGGWRVYHTKSLFMSQYTTVAMIIHYRFNCGVLSLLELGRLLQHAVVYQSC